MSVKLEVGAFYTQSHALIARSRDARRITAIENGKIDFISGGWKRGSVSERTFAKWAGYRLDPDEIANRFALLVNLGDVSIWHVGKYDWPMDYLYSLHPQALFAEEPAAQPQDYQHHIDVRDLPARYRAMLDVEIPPPRHLSDPFPLEASRRERAAHVAAFAMAIGGGLDLREFTVIPSLILNRQEGDRDDV